MVEKRDYRVSKIIDAPLGYVYEWCTDYREDDGKIMGGTYVRHILQKTKKRVVWISHGERDGRATEGVRIVTLRPPNRWHLDRVDDGREETADYELTSLGRKRTGLQMSTIVRYVGAASASRKESAERASREWDLLKKALESDYRGRSG